MYSKTHKSILATNRPATNCPGDESAVMNRPATNRRRRIVTYRSVIPSLCPQLKENNSSSLIRAVNVNVQCCNFLLGKRGNTPKESARKREKEREKKRKGAREKREISNFYSSKLRQKINPKSLYFLSIPKFSREPSACRVFFSKMIKKKVGKFY